MGHVCMEKSYIPGGHRVSDPLLNYISESYVAVGIKTLECAISWIKCHDYKIQQQPMPTEGLHPPHLLPQTYLNTL